MRSMAVASEHELVGRGAELDRVREFLSRGQEGPRAMIIRGEAGIGKTSLWRAAIDSDDVRQLRVLSMRCVEAELPLGLAGLADLLQDAFPVVADELADHERSTLAVAIGLEPPQERPREAIALPRAFLAVLRALSRDVPVLVAIDDVQWLDAPSARVLSFAARRLGDTCVEVLVTLRDGWVDPLGLANTFGDRYEEVHLGSLSLGALSHLIRTRLGVRIPRPLLARVYDASGGNPMFALEFARAVEEGGGSHLGPVPIPNSLQELVRARLDQQPDVRRLLAIVAACDHPTPAFLAAVDSSAAALIEVAVDAGLLAIGEDNTVRFTHPLLASASYAELRPSDRRAVHTEIAQVLDDVEAQARHFALGKSGPDESVASLLDDAAARARARGAPETAAELAEEAVRSTPTGDAELDQRTFSVAEYLAAAGRSVNATEWVDKLLTTELTGPLRAQALILRCWLEHDIDAAGPILDEAFEHVGDQATPRAHLFLLRSSYYTYLEDLDLAASSAAAREALATAERAGDPVLLAAALALVADRADLAGHPDDGLLERATALEDASGSMPGFTTARERLGNVLFRRGDLSEARRQFETVIEKALRVGAAAACYRAAAHLFDVEWRAGNWQLAERCLEDAWSGAVEDLGDQWARAELPERRARLCALRGEVDHARKRVAEGIEGAERIHWAFLAKKNRWVLGFLELSLGEPERAWQVLEDVSRTPARGSLEVLEAVADAVEALVALDRLDEAVELLTTLREEAVSRDHRWAAAAAERGNALLSIARGDLAAAVIAAESAADGFESISFPLDQGRALFVAGEALRRSGNRSLAAENIEAAKEIFARVGAVLWIERAEAELRRARPRPRRDRDLTSAERRVAALAASGKTNREIAAQLFTTEGTVEKHLTRIYRKLGVRSRTELARRVADGSLLLNDG
jgi:DNA-binding NarL/FixJ family response regulator